MSQYDQYLQNAQVLMENVSNNINSVMSYLQFESSPLYLMLVFLVMLLMLRLIKRRKKVKLNPKKNPLPEKVTKGGFVGMESIAGDNVIATQLDLARAYIEMDKKKMAKSILSHVINQGTEDQKLQARQLIETL